MDPLPGIEIEGGPPETAWYEGHFGREAPVKEATSSIVGKRGRIDSVRMPGEAVVVGSMFFFFLADGWLFTLAMCWNSLFVVRSVFFFSQDEKKYLTGLER
jgi:hypothetical protein